MSTSSFASVAFKVEPDNGFFPEPEYDNDGIRSYGCKALFASLSAYDQMAAKLSIVTVKRPLGQTSYNITVDAGYGQGSLIVPLYGGTQRTYLAVLTEFKRTQGYGRRSLAEFWADLSFIVVPTG